jgi:hypothetical protein
MTAEGVGEAAMMTAAHLCLGPGMITVAHLLRVQATPSRVRPVLPVFLRRAPHNLNVTMITGVAMVAAMTTMLTEMATMMVMTLAVEIMTTTAAMTTELLEQ